MGQQLAGLKLHAMVAAMKKPQRHVFVCTNTRDVGGRPSCGSQGQKVLEALTDALARNADVWATTAVTGCQCLGPCFEGPNVVVYPEAIWYQGVEAADAEIIVEQHLRNGNPVARLLRQDSDVSEEP